MVIFIVYITYHVVASTWVSDVSLHSGRLVDEWQVESLGLGYHHDEGSHQIIAFGNCGERKRPIFCWICLGPDNLHTHTQNHTNFWQFLICFGRQTRHYVALTWYFSVVNFMISTSWILTSNRLPAGLTTRYMNAFIQAECFQMFRGDQDDTELHLESWNGKVVLPKVTVVFQQAASPRSSSLSISHGFLGAVTLKIEHAFSSKEVTKNRGSISSCTLQQLLCYQLGSFNVTS